jgi:serine/threonine protein kinase
MKDQWPQLSGYRIIAPIHEDTETAICRGIRIYDKNPVVLKILKPDRITPINVSLLKNEYELARDIKAVNVVSIYSMEMQEQSCFLVFEDFEGIHLDPDSRGTGGNSRCRNHPP